MIRNFVVSALTLACLIHTGRSLDVIGSSSKYTSTASHTLSIPAGTASGDLLLLSFMVSDDMIPIDFPGWTPAASCFKGSAKTLPAGTTQNQQAFCDTRETCRSSGDKTTSNGLTYCKWYKNFGDGIDLATSIFWKRHDGKSSSVSVTYPDSGHRFAILMSFRGAYTSPIGEVRTTSFDQKAQSVFPAVTGSAGDIVVLAMSFDDVAAQSAFTPPSGFSLAQYVTGPDEAGFQYYKKLTTSGSTGQMITGGGGGSGGKDALISLVIKAGPGGTTPSASYVLSTASSGCSSGTSAITSSTTCQQAATSLRMTWKGTGSWSTSPKGCFAKNNVEVWYNTIGAGASNGNTQKTVCRKASGAEGSLEGPVDELFIGGAPTQTFSFVSLIVAVAAML